MKVLMVTNAIAPDKLGGLERYVRELAAALVRKGHDVTTLSKRTAPDQASAETGDDGVRLLRFTTPAKSDPLFVAKYPLSVASAVRRTVLGADYDVLHGHYPISMLPVTTTRIPYIYTFHAPVYKEVLGERQGEYRAPGPVSGATVRAMKGIERRVLEHAEVVVTLSDFVASEMRANTRPGSTSWQKIPGGLQTDYFTPVRDADTPVPVDRPLIVTARRLVERTGVELLVAAMAEVLRTHPTAQLVITGDGPRRAPIEKQLADLGIAESVHLLGRVSDSDLLAWYRTADLVVTPTLELEGFGLSTAEAMSCGTPVVVTPVGANTEVVAGLGPRFVARSTDPADIAATLKDVLGDPELLRQKRGEARDLVHPRFGWDHVADAYLETYARLPRRR
ncbi:glycosyltransferase family 4 protein [Microlunatus aurantiacus]|uniref:glycosyltransferase family 4 protein n=1 Tax=Microlunatus aurantiacus TaxID=446786 RepID=UPI0031D1E4BA